MRIMWPRCERLILVVSNIDGPAFTGGIKAHARFQI